MSELPIHKIEHISDYGVLVRKISSAQLKNAIRYIHRDDYYLFGLTALDSNCPHAIFSEAASKIVGLAPYMWSSSLA